MQTLVEAPAENTAKPVISPAHQRWAREPALIAEKIGGADAERFLKHFRDPVEREAIAAAVAALEAEGVGPRRAAVLLARLRAGDLRVIPGGGQPPAAPRRPVLRLIQQEIAS